VGDLKKMSDDTHDVEEEILRLSRLVSEAEMRKDASVVSSYIDQDYVGIDPSGEIIDRSTLIGRYHTAGFNLDRLQLSEVKVRACQDTAWESGTMDLAGNLGARRFSGTYRYSHFWVRAGSSWLIAASQLTPVVS
jgi:hypothetical protein